jgi:hypothetical protein
MFPKKDKIIKIMLLIQYFLYLDEFSYKLLIIKFQNE